MSCGWAFAGSYIFLGDYYIFSPSAGTWTSIDQQGYSVSARGFLSFTSTPSCAIYMFGGLNLGVNTPFIILCVSVCFEDRRQNLRGDRWTFRTCKLCSKRTCTNRKSEFALIYPSVRRNSGFVVVLSQSQHNGCPEVQSFLIQDSMAFFRRLKWFLRILSKFLAGWTGCLDQLWYAILYFARKVYYTLNFFSPKN